MILLTGWSEGKFVLQVMDDDGRNILQRISLTPAEWVRCMQAVIEERRKIAASSYPNDQGNYQPKKRTASDGTQNKHLRAIDFGYLS